MTLPGRLHQERDLAANAVPAAQFAAHFRHGAAQELLVNLGDLTANDDIVLLMGTDNPDDDPRKTIDLCPLYRTVSSTIFIEFTELTSEVT